MSETKRDFLRRIECGEVNTDVEQWYSDLLEENLQLKLKLAEGPKWEKEKEKLVSKIEGLEDILDDIKYAVNRADW